MLSFKDNIKPLLHILLIMAYNVETSSNGDTVMTVDPVDFRIEDLDGMKILPQGTTVAPGYVRLPGEVPESPVGIQKSYPHIFPEPEDEPLDRGLIKKFTGGDTLYACDPITFNRQPTLSGPLPKRTPMKPYPREGNHVTLPDDVVAEAEKKFEAQQRQLTNLNKRFEKGKISEKNYLHQAKSILG